MSHLIIMPVLLPLLTGILLLLSSGRNIVLLRCISLLSVTALVVISAALLSSASASTGTVEVYALGNWEPPFGIVLVLDRLSALMVLLTAVLALFSLGYAARGNDLPGDSLHALTHFLLMGLNGAFLTGDIFNLFVFFEVLLLASYGLLLHGGGPERTRAGMHYVILNLAGSSLFLIAVAVLYGLTGTLNMADMAVRVAQLDPGTAPLVATAALLLMVVFSLKAALAPIYFWLPKAYASTSAPVAAMFAIMTKVGVYALIRVYTLVFGDTAGPLANIAWPWLWPAALVTLALAFIGVLAARDLRTQVAYLVVVSVGTLVAGIALHTERALSATLYYLIHSTLVCGALFLVVDLIQRQRGAIADRIEAGPRIRQGALLGGLFFIGAVSVIGLPPLSGFIGKALILKAADSGVQAVWLWTAILASGLASLTALSRSGSTVFWRSQEAAVTTARVDPWATAVAAALLATGPALAIWGNPVLQYTEALAQQLLQPGEYIYAVLSHIPAKGD